MAVEASEKASPETEKSYEKVDEILDFEQFSVTKMLSSSILYHFMLA